MTGSPVARPGARLGASGVRGVTWSASHKRWQVHLSIGQGRKRYLGRFVELADAILAADIARRGLAADALASADLARRSIVAGPDALASGEWIVIHGTPRFFPGPGSDQG